LSSRPEHAHASSAAGLTSNLRRSARRWLTPQVSALRCGGVSERTHFGRRRAPVAERLGGGGEGIPGDQLELSAVRGCRHTEAAEGEKDHDEPDGEGCDQHVRGGCDEVLGGILTPASDKNIHKPPQNRYLRAKVNARVGVAQALLDPIARERTPSAPAGRFPRWRCLWVEMTVTRPSTPIFSTPIFREPRHLEER